MKKYDLLTPDGFSINPSKTYTTPKQILMAFNDWKKQFEKQGYYSHEGEKIPLVDLENYCNVIQIN